MSSRKEPSPAEHRAKGSAVGFIYVVPSVRRDYLQPSLKEVPTWFERAIYFGPCKIPMRPRMQPGDFIFGISPANGSARRIIFTGRIKERLSYARAFEELPKLRGPNGPIHVRPTRSPGLGFPDSHYEHIPGANHPDSWRSDLRTPELDVFFVCERAEGVLGQWLGPSGPVLSADILRFLRGCNVHGGGGACLGKNSFATESAPVAFGRLYRGLHLETDDPKGLLRLVGESTRVAEDGERPYDANVAAQVASLGGATYRGCRPKSKRDRTVLFARVGADQSPGGGCWNGPIDVATNAFCYVPIPETKSLRTGLGTPYTDISPALATFGLTLPAELIGRCTHLDPDFEFSTYGDRGTKGAQLSRNLREGDLLVFYAGLRSIAREGRLVYAIIGALSVVRIVKAADRESAFWHENAHTRRELPGNADDVVVIGNPRLSGRLHRAIPIGDFRAGAYRVPPSLLHAWGGITAKDGFLQRSAVFPSASDPEKFLRWWSGQALRLIASNNPPL
jgi:hypothetical protein